MAAFGTRSGSPRNRGGSAGFRFSLYALFSVLIMVLDQRLDWLERVRFALQAVTYPVEVVLNSPVTGWHWLEREFASRRALEAENGRLRQRLRELEMRSLRVDALAAQNAALIGLKRALPPVAERWLPADIVNIELGGLRQRILVNRGERNGVFRNQAVLDDYGVVGQTMHVGPWSADVLLITDPDQDLPVQIERTGLRTIAVGTGDPGALALPFLPANANIRVGDVLVTSGLGGVFPSGYPVGRVTDVHPDAAQPLARVVAAPFAHLQTDRAVMLVWFRQGSPAAPLKEKGGELTRGNAAIQPLRAPKHSGAPAPGTAARGPSRARAAQPAPARKPATHAPAKPKSASAPSGHTRP